MQKLILTQKLDGLKNNETLADLELFNLLFDSSQISSHRRHVAQLDHSVVQVVKHRLEMNQEVIVKMLFCTN